MESQTGVGWCSPACKCVVDPGGICQECQLQCHRWQWHMIDDDLVTCRWNPECVSVLIATSLPVTGT